ncbi:GIY-YIG nuclease family protein [Epibacterium sp. DP7N7-1]|nr:GIY-YIG nuclease family protein [Epibacterium sp. DP7N7-1]
MTDFQRQKKIANFVQATSADPNKLKKLLPPLSEERKRLIHKSYTRAKYLDLAQSMNGSGHYVDQKFREFVREYNNRVFEGYGSEQPSSFQVMKDFVEPDDQSLVLKILPETFHSLDVNFILERLTDPHKKNASEDLFQLRNAHIYQVNIAGGHDALNITGVGNLSLFGVSFIRHGDELSIFALGAKKGKIGGLPAMPVEDAHFDPTRPFLKRESETLDFNHEQFYNLQNHYPIVFLSRFDLRRKTTLVRYVLIERKDSFDSFSDDREMFTGLLSQPFNQDIDSTSKHFDRSHAVLLEHASVFAMMGDVPHVVLGLDDEDDLTIVRSPTEIHLNGKKTEIRKLKRILTREEARNFAPVKTIIWENRPPASYNLAPTQFKIEQKGYWKSLNPDQVGEGKNGERVEGKTWVTVNETWSESFGFEPPENSSNLVVTTGADGAEVGEIYVMRSASHPRDTFKIGFTTKTADERATQLQSTSGQPDQINVVQSWEVTSPRRVEGMVHERLAGYRINPKREFFQLKYSRVREVIEDVIEMLDATPKNT